mmetsp:Transcript_33534/g.98808  ORF Transcript_33534/g.98808 Transcript_33534/m.98808 type:complete len:203 (+) Transcript_33534:470-1078(+)
MDAILERGCCLQRISEHGNIFQCRIRAKAIIGLDSVNGITQKDGCTTLIDPRASVSKCRKIGRRLFGHQTRGLVVNERTKLQEFLIKELTKLFWIRIGLGQFVILFHEQKCTVRSLIVRGQSLERNPATPRSGGVIQVESPIRWDLDRDSFVNALVVIFETLDLERLDSAEQSLKSILIGSALVIFCLHGVRNASGGTIRSN